MTNTALNPESHLSTDHLPAPPRHAAFSPRISVFGVDIDPLTLEQAAARIGDWLAAEERLCRYVVTPNVDHVVQWQTNPPMLSAYREASLIVADGWPVVAAANLLGRPLPERVAGSDLVPRVIAAGLPDARLKVFLLGAAAGVGLRAAAAIQRSWPHVHVVGVYSPPFRFESDPEENEKIVGLVNAAGPDLLVLGLGTPKQEIWIHRHRDRLDVKVAVAAGATIDFLAGEQVRAPRWVQRLNLEWFHRLVRDPRRLARRYLHDAWVFPRLLVREYAASLRDTRREKTYSSRSA